jgi:putative xylitol transport system ATP-binding protein
MVTEDRKATGLVLGSPIAHNLSISVLSRLRRFGLVRRVAEKDLVGELVARLRVKAASTDLPVSSLSGGNQQKVVLGRCLSTQPRLLICDEPTRGVDEGAKQEIYRLIEDFARRGGAVLMVSSEVPELLQVSDRIAVFKAGRLAGTLDGSAITPHQLTHLSS